VEKSARHAETLRHNFQLAGFPDDTLRMRVQDVFVALAQLAEAGERFDLILADPPYGEKNIGRRSTSLAQQLLDDVKLPAILAADGLFVLGHTKRDTLSLPDPWEERKLLKHGDSIMRFLMTMGGRQDAGPEDLKV
jgi:23S rRNA G2069 N7-methylase RlmK/C1962 C5-methylase RlmI